MPQPSLSPVSLAPMVCFECSEVMRPTVVPTGTGTKPKKLNKIVYYCDNCQYGFEVTKTHVTGINHKYSDPPKRVPEPMAVLEPMKSHTAHHEKDESVPPGPQQPPQQNPNPVG